MEDVGVVKMFGRNDGKRLGVVVVPFWWCAERKRGVVALD